MPQRTRRFVALVALLAMFTPLTAWAQQPPIPERFATTSADTDIPGGDIASVFDITLQRCHAACLGNGDCYAFTFDQRNGACFLKEAGGEPVAFEGAVSGVITTRPTIELERAAAAAAELTFLEAYDLDMAREQAATSAELYMAQGFSESAWLEYASTLEPSDAVAATGAAVTVGDSGPAWLAHARALSTFAGTAGNRTYDVFRRLTSAATNAALRLDGPGKADALLLLAQGLEGTYRGVAALAAARLADRYVPGIAPEELARLRELFGFRVLGNDVDALGEVPRICIAFSEALAPELDYGPFVQRASARLAVEVEGQRLCVTGVSYGESYRLVVRAGLPSAAGETLPADVPVDVYVRDRGPVVRFPGRAYVLPAHGPRAIPIETVNADDLDLTLLRVSDRNLVAAVRDGSFLQSLSAWQGDRFEDLLTERVWQGEAHLDGELNRATTSLLPLDEVGDLAPGVYVLRAAVTAADTYDVPPAMQWFLVSDLGVTTLAGNDGVHVVVQRLSDGQPVGGLRVALVARSNRVLGEATTDEQGHASFPAALALGGGNAAPALVLVDAGDDMAVLSLDEPEFDLSDRGVAGRTAPGPLDVFLTPDRGAYRPGETIHLTVLVRDAAAAGVTGLPLTVRLLRPDGVEYASVLEARDMAGGYVVDLALGTDVPRGVWRVDVLVDPTGQALASRGVLVEDFIPERIDVTLTLGGDELVDTRSAPDLQVAAEHLFGAPAAGMAVTGTVTVSATSELPGWPGYEFGRFDEGVDTQARPFPADLRTGEDGTLAVPLRLDDLVLAARPYVLAATATVSDGASRPVERSLVRPLRPALPVLGIRPGFDGALAENADATFDLALVAPDGAAMTGDVEWQVDRVETRYQWYSVDGRWYWEPVSQRQRVADGTVTLGADGASVSVPVVWGRYELRATYRGASVASASVAFSAGWAAADATRDTPDLLAVSLDRTSYAPGDVARLRLEPEEPGMALVSVLSDRVVDLRLVPVEGETTVELPVTDEWGTGVYVTASLVRPSDAPDHLPSRSLGLAYTAVAPGPRALDVDLDVAGQTRSGTSLPVTLTVQGLADGPAYATVAVVDLGVLNLTGFTAPDPSGYYFGQRRLGVAIRDLYGRLIDARQGAIGEVRSGGGTDAAAAATGPVPAQDVLALFSGPVRLVDGRAELSFDLPAFDGAVRVMAVVWTEKAVGGASTDVLVRDPVVIQASLPRFLTPSDHSRLRVELTHVDGPAGSMRLVVRGHGLGEVPAGVTLDPGGRAVIDVPLSPTELGEHVYGIELTTPDGSVLARELRLTVQHTDPETARSTRLVLAPGESFVFDDGAIDGFLPGTARATLAAGAGAALDLPGLVMRLDGYPYGCTEQIASSLQPILLASSTVTRLGLMTDAEAMLRVQHGVDRLLTRQGRNGGFGLWSAEGFDLWLDAYVTEALLNAEAYGAAVSATALRQALDNLRNRVAQAGSLYDGAASYAYAFAVLARAGEAVIGDLRYYADVLPERFDTPLAAAHLAAALASYGERERSEAMFARAQELALAEADEAGWRTDYGTTLRDRAALLALATQAGSTVVDRARLAGLVAAGGPAHGLSTQEATWVMRAAAALGAAAQGLEVDGVPVTGDALRLFAGTPVTLTNSGDEDVPVTVTTFGVAAEPQPAGGVGYAIERSLYTLAGEPVDPDAIHVGDSLVVVLEVRPERGVPGGRLMIDDALPAGLEIDNANLLRSGDVGSLDWLVVESNAATTEARADRFLAAVDWTSQEPLRLAYVARAVTPGDYHHAAPLVQDMYRPTNRAVGDTGRLVVRP